MASRTGKNKGVIKPVCVPARYFISSTPIPTGPGSRHPLLQRFVAGLAAVPPGGDARSQASVRPHTGDRK